jgi:hypothetical protein
MNPLQQKELLDKLQKQNAQAGYDTSVTVIPPNQPVQTTQPVSETVTQPIIKPVQTSQVSQPVVEASAPATPPIPPMQPTQSSVATPIEPQPENTRDLTAEKSRTERIAELEHALGDSVKETKDMTAKARAYLDDFGSETFYVKNISNGHVAISDIDVTVQRGKSEDLLKYADLESIKKSRDLRAAIGYDKKPNPYKRSLLLRLTPEEYEIEKTKELQNKQKVDQFKQNQAVIHAQQQQAQPYNAVTQQPILQPQTPRIRPTVLSKLEKLRLSSVPENAHLGLAPEEFVEWAVTESLSIEELDFIISHPNVVNNPNIRTALYEKRSEMT